MRHIKHAWIYIFLVVIALTPLLWYLHHPGQLINGLDTNFPLNPTVWFQRRLFIWNDSLNGGSHMNSSVAGLFFHFLQYIPYIAGFSLQLTQKFTFVFWFGMTAFSAFIFSQTFLTKKRTLQLFFILLYSFNIYLFNTWENSKVANLALVVGLPLVLSLIELSRQKKISLLTLFALQAFLSIIIAGAGINPAYFAALAFAVVLYVGVFLLKNDKTLLLKSSVVTLIAIVGVSLFWLIPLLDFLFFSSKVSTLEGIGFTNWVASLSQNTSLVNVLRLMGAWDWYVKDNANTPIYIPYAIKYFESLPFIFMSFVVPGMAFAGLCIKKNVYRVERLYFIILVVFGVFLGAGLHEPTGGVFSILLNKLPFFSFFRSPWYIFTPYTIIGLGGLAVFFLDSLEKRVPRQLYFTSLFVLMIGYALYSYPLITGKIFRPGREDSFYVSTPRYVFDFAQYISTSPNNRIITYPDDQLEKFKWGYKGTDSFLGLFVNKEVYAPSFNYPNKYVESFLDTFYLRLRKGQADLAVKMLPTIGVDSLLYKTDAETLSPDISSSFASMNIKSFGPWGLVDIGNAEIATVVRNIYTSAISPSGLSFLSPYLPEQSVVVAKNDSQLEKLPTSLSRLDLFEINPVATESGETYAFETQKPGEYTLALEEVLSSDKSAKILLDQKEIQPESVSSDARQFKVNLSPGKHVVNVSYPTNDATVPLIFSQDFTLSQLIQTNKRITIPISNFSPFVTYDINFNFKYIYGSLPQIQVVQSYDKAPLKVEGVKISKNEDWLEVHHPFSPVALNSKLELIISIADSTDSSISKSMINGIKITRVVNNRMFVIENPQNVLPVPHVSLTKMDPTNYMAEVQNAENGYFLLFKENYQNGWTVSSKDYIGGKPIHMQANGMYNLWFVPVGKDLQHISITFLPQQTYKDSLFATGIVLIIATGILVLNIKKKYEGN